MDKQDVRKFAPYAVPCNVFKILKGSFRNLTLPDSESHNSWRFHELLVCFYSRRGLGLPVLSEAKIQWLCGTVKKQLKFSVGVWICRFILNGA